MNLSKSIKLTRVVNALTASQTTTTSTILDMQGFDGVKFDLSLGSTVTDTSVVSMILRNGTSNSTSSMVAKGTVTVTAASTSANNGLLTIDGYRLLNRYVDVQITRGTANAVVDSVVASQYCPSLKATTNDATTVLASTFVLGS